MVFILSGSFRLSNMFYFLLLTAENYFVWTEKFILIDLIWNIYLNKNIDYFVSLFF